MPKPRIVFTRLTVRDLQSCLRSFMQAMDADTFETAMAPADLWTWKTVPDVQELLTMLPLCRIFVRKSNVIKLSHAVLVLALLELDKDPEETTMFSNCLWFHFSKKYFSKKVWPIFNPSENMHNVRLPPYGSIWAEFRFNSFRLVKFFKFPFLIERTKQIHKVRCPPYGSIWGEFRFNAFRFVKLFRFPFLIKRFKQLHKVRYPPSLLGLLGSRRLGTILLIFSPPLSEGGLGSGPAYQLCTRVFWLPKALLTYV